jgi:hypothetical protein
MLGPDATVLATIFPLASAMLTVNKRPGGSSPRA